MTEDNQTNLLVSIISGVFLLFSTWKFKFLTPVFDKIKSIKNKKNANKFIDSLKRMGKIYETIENIAANTNADRVILFSGHNCGGLPKIYKPYWVSALHGVGIDKEMLTNYTNIHVDADYIKMILNCYENGFVHLKYENMESGQLKSIYELEGVQESIVYYLGVMENNLLFISAASRKQPLTKKDQTFIALQANLIKNSLEQDL